MSWESSPLAQTHKERQAALERFFSESSATVECTTKTYLQIGALLTEAVLTVAADKAHAYRLCEQAMDLEYKLNGDCDPSARVQEALLGEWEPPTEEGES